MKEKSFITLRPEGVDQVCVLAAAFRNIPSSDATWASLATRRCRVARRSGRRVLRWSGCSSKRLFNRENIGCIKEYKRGKYHCTIDLLFYWFGISCMTTDNFCFYLQNRLIWTSQIGGQWYSDTSPCSIPWPYSYSDEMFLACLHFQTNILEEF